MWVVKSVLLLSWRPEFDSRSPRNAEFESCGLEESRETHFWQTFKFVGGSRPVITTCDFLDKLWEEKLERFSKPFEKFWMTGKVFF